LGRWFDLKNITPRFEFGFGLSYTTFAYRNLHISNPGRHRRRALGDTTESSSPSNATSVNVSSAAATSSAAANSSASAPVSASGVSVSTTASASVSASAPSSTSSAPSAGSSPVGEIGGPAALYKELLTVSFTVQNTGGASGSEVSQLYLGFPAGTGQPPKVLRAFERTELGQRQSKTVTLSLRQKDVSVWDVVTQKWVIPKGTFQVFVGSSSRKVQLQGTFSL
jgi:beta-glucosidase